MLEAAENVFVIPFTRARPGGPFSESANDDDDKNEQPSPNKRPRIEQEEEVPDKDHHHQSSSMDAVLYWPDSPEARQVFQPTSTGGRSTSSTRRRRGSASAAPVGNADTTPEYEMLTITVQSSRFFRFGRDQLFYVARISWRYPT